MKLRAFMFMVGSLEYNQHQIEFAMKSCTPDYIRESPAECAENFVREFLVEGHGADPRASSRQVGTVPR